MKFWQKSLQARLTLYFVLFLLISGALVGVLAYGLTRTALETDVLQRLETAATLKENEINRWLVEKKQEARLLSKTPIIATSVETLLTLDKAEPAAQQAYDQLSGYLTDVLAESPSLLEIWLLDEEGRVVYASDEAKEGNFHVTDTFFVEGLKDTFTQNVYFLPAIDRTTVTIANPMSNETGQTAGVLVAHLNLDRLDEIILERAGLGKTGETYLIDSLNVFISQAGVDPAAFPRGVHTEGIDRAITGENGSGSYPNYNNIPVIGVYRWLPDHDMALLAEMTQSEALAPANRLGAILAVITLLVIGLGSLAGYLTARQISRPVVTIAQTASQVALGDLTQRVPVTTEDEIGDLAQTFNQMTIQLEELYNTLEDQIVARTRRLETIAVLGERLSAILDLEQLLQTLVDQIQKSYGYYHAHVFITSLESKSLVMRAGTGEAGTAMKAQGHHIPLNAPTSLVAQSARNSEIISIDNVREDPNWLPNPLLPETYSEMAVPIMLENQVVGVLDVQGDKIAGLDEGDAALLRSLANQVAVAIRNARLFRDVETALEQARAAQEQYVQRAWQSQSGKQFGYDQQQPGEGMLTAAELEQLHWTATQQTQLAVVGPEQADTEAEVPYLAVVAPIKLQDRVIGTMEFHDTVLERRQQWSEQELALVQAIADQVAQTAENLRLFDETRQRASQEQTLREITDRLRASQNLEQLLNIATEAIGKHMTATHARLELGVRNAPAGNGNTITTGG